MAEPSCDPHGAGSWSIIQHGTRYPACSLTPLRTFCLCDTRDSHIDFDMLSILSIAVALCTLFVALRLYEVEIEEPKKCPELPWVAVRKRLFARTRAGIQFMKSYRIHLQQAYDEVRK